MRHCIQIVILLLSINLCQGAEPDPYETYVKTSRDFQTVKQEKAWAYKRFPSWTLMPWTHQWNIGFTDESGRWSQKHGYNGAFIDRSDISSSESKTGRLDWINRFQLRFYADHIADKGLLHLWDGDKVKPHLSELHGTGIRNVPLNAATRNKLQQHIRKNISVLKSSPFRAAYALDDEPSWGHFVHPTMWQVTDDASAYPKWLAEVYGKSAPKRNRWVSYEDIRPMLSKWSIQDFDASPLMDQWTFNDAYWANYLGDLVEYANTIDPETPCGIVGGQSPNAFGGFDYARLMRKVQFIESYNLGSSHAIIRSFNPQNALPAVTTLFHKTVEDTIWQTWYYLAHGNRGHIAWVEGWFDGKTPKPWHEKVAPTFLDAGKKIGPLVAEAEWIHDGIAIYYSHPSIQLGWIMDAEAHGKTWINRNNDERSSSSSHVRHAWENMLRDAGLQYNYLSYVDVIQKGIPNEYKVLILPACLCLSDAEATQIKAFCQRGGTVIADYLPGLWDQHGKGRSTGGVLDSMFGVKHDPELKAEDLFGGKLWVEVDQDANYSWKSYESFLTNKNNSVRDVCGYNRAVQSMPIKRTNRFGKGSAVLMNLSPQWYNAYRVQGMEGAGKRVIFLDHIKAANIEPRVRLKNPNEATHGYEITYWSKKVDGVQRTILFLCLNPEITGNSLGGGNSEGLKTAKVPVILQFRNAIQQVRDERTGKELGAGSEFAVDWQQNEAVVLSFVEKQ
jgi:hypothetical protein